MQTAYQVMVATASGLTWDSGKILSDVVNQIVDAGHDPATLALIYLVQDLIQQWTALTSAL